MSTAIQKAEPSIIDTLTNAKWSREIIEVVRQQKCPRGISDAEFFVFMQQCQQSGLNPILGHAYCVPRNVKTSKKGEPDRWTTVHVFQPAIDGMRARAAEFPDFISTNAAPVFANDLITLDPGRGEVMHKSNPIKPGALVGAWARVEKKGAIPVVVWLPVTARSGDSAFWRADPGGMLSKCAEALALRRAYPVAFGGMHIAEEMPAEAAEPTRADVVLQRVDAPAKEAPALPAAGPTVQFGAFKGRPIGALSRAEVEEAVKEGEWWKEQNPKAKAKVLEALDTNLAELRAALSPEKAEPEDATTEPLPISHPDAEPPDEPGSAG